MPKQPHQKLRILYVLDYLRTESGKDNPISTQQLMEMVQHRFHEQFGQELPCDRKTIYSDIAELKEYGIPIETVRDRTFSGYYIPNTFQLSELRLLINAVQSSRYLTTDTTRSLISKLCTLCNRTDAGLIRKNVIVSGRVKSMNESIYENVDTIQEAISKNVQITFHYFDWRIDRQRHYRTAPGSQTPRLYCVSPSALQQDHENCYLIAYTPSRGITHYRVDRMCNIRLTQQRRPPESILSGEELNRRQKQNFNMFSGDQTKVKLLFHNSITNAVFDRFGQDEMYFPYDDDHFTLTTEVALSDQFYGWVFGLGEQASILYPPQVVEAYAQRCRAALNAALAAYPKEKEPNT